MERGVVLPAQWEALASNSCPMACTLFLGLLSPHPHEPILSAPQSEGLAPLLHFQESLISSSLRCRQEYWTEE